MNPLLQLWTRLTLWISIKIFKPILAFFNEMIIKFKGLDSKIQEGIVLLLIALSISLPLSFWSKYFSETWLFIIGLEFYVYAFLYINKIELFPPYFDKKYFSIGSKSNFTDSSLFLRAGRILFYLLILSGSSSSNFFINFIAITIIAFWIYGFLLVYYEHNPKKGIWIYFRKYKGLINATLVVASLAVLGTLLRLYNVYDMGTWDEGWFSNITYYMYQSQNWLEPTYYQDFSGALKLFDKPPLLFILGSVGIELFGYTSFAAKLIMGLFSGLMGVAGYLIYAHQKNEKTKFIPETSSESEEEAHIQEDKVDLDIEPSDGNVTGVIFGLMMAVTWFLVFYGRTAYLDAAIVALTAFTALFAIKAIDHWFYGNHNRAYVYLVLTMLVNMIDLLAKAWQGLIVGPAIAIYLIARYYEFMIPKNGVTSFYSRIRKKIFLTSSDLIPSLLAILSAIFAYLSIPIINQETFLQMEFQGFIFDFWHVLIAILIFVYVRAITAVLFDDNKTKLDSSIFYYQLNDNNSDYLTKFKKLFPILGLYSIIIAVIGYISAFIGISGFQFIYERLYVAFEQIGERYFTVFDDIESRIFYAEILLGLTSFFVAALVMFIVIFISFVFLFGFIELLYYLIKRESLFEISYSYKIISEWSLLVPVSFFGVAIGYWAYFLLFKGEIFDRDLSQLFLAGIVLPIIAFVLAIGYIYVLLYIWRNIIKKEKTPEIDFWIKKFLQFSIFLMIMTILITVSFYPLLTWIDYMDTQIVNNPLPIRVPGELYNDPRDLCASSDALLNPDIDCKPAEGQLTYNWLFYVYYIGWRYGGYGKYSVVDSLGGLLGPLFLMSIPFFITGIYALVKKREFPNLLLYFSWLSLVLLTFLPATFQLNYYYLAVFFPFYGISANGFFWAFRKTKSSIHFRDINEKMLLIFPIVALLFISHIFYPYLQNFEFINNYDTLINFLASLLILIIGYLVFAYFLVRSIPGAFSLAFMVFFFHKYFVDQGYGNFDPDLLIMSIILIGMTIYTIKDRVPLSSAFFLFLIIFTAATASAWWVHYKSDTNNGFEKMGNFIISHDGDYNESTWVYGETGTRFAMRYYLNGHITANERGYTFPFSQNSSIAMENYLRDNNQVKFFIVLNSSPWEDITPMSDYEHSYIWLKNNFAWVNPLLDLPDWHHIHLFANKTVLSASENLEIGNYVNN